MKVVQRVALAAFFFCVGALAMCGCSQPEKQGYQRYEGQVPGARTLCAEYPAGWRTGSHWGDRGSFYQLLFFPEHGTVPRPLIAVSVYSSSKLGVQEAQQFLDDTVGKRMLFGHASILGTSSLDVAGAGALQAVVRYRRPRDIHKLTGEMIFIKERIVILRTADEFLMLRFEHDEQNFEATSPLFDHFLSTLELK